MTTTTGIASTTATETQDRLEVPIDPQTAEVWLAQPELHVGPDDVVRIVYQSGDRTVSLAVCEEFPCSGLMISQVVAARRSLGWVIGTPLPAGGAIVFSQTGTEASETSIRVCHSDQCAGAVTHPAPATLGPWISTDVAVDRKGAPLVLSVYFGPPASAVTLRCQDALCEDTSNFIAFATDQNVGDGAVGFDEDVPVLAVAVAEGFQIGRCDRAMPSAPNCSSDSISWFLVEAPDSVRGPKMIVRPDGSPTLVVFVEQRPGAPVAGPEIITAVSCHDPTCEERTIADLAVVDDALAEWDIAMTPEGLLSVAWTERGAVRLAHCDDALCQSHHTVDLGIEGVGVSIDYRSDGSPVVAVHSRERGLELVYCGDRDCSVPE